MHPGPQPPASDGLQVDVRPIADPPLTVGPSSAQCWSTADPADVSQKAESILTVTQVRGLGQAVAQGRSLAALDQASGHGRHALPGSHPGQRRQGGGSIDSCQWVVALGGVHSAGVVTGQSSGQQQEDQGQHDHVVVL